MKRNLQSIRRGFTLVELSLAILMGMVTGSMVLVLFNQQLAFLDIYRKQSFLAEEAPMISLYVSRLVGKADRFRLHDSVADALANRNPRGGAFDPSSPVVALSFRQADTADPKAGTDAKLRTAILSFENRGKGPALYYYVVPINGVLGEPQWSVSNKAGNVEFFMEKGVLRMTLTGPQGEQITYSGTMQQ